MSKRQRCDGGGHQFDVYYPTWARSLSGGKARIFRTFDDPKIGATWVAQEEAKKKAILAGAEKQTVGINTMPDLTFLAASGLWLKAFTGARATRDWYQILLRAHLVPHFGNFRCSHIGRAEVLTYLEAREKLGASLDARAKELTILRAALRWVRDGGYPVDMTAWAVKKPEAIPKVTRRYDPSVMRRLRAACENDRERAILEVALMTGMRRGELKAFDCSWVRWRERVIVLPADQEFAPKSRKSRAIPLFDALKQRLVAWLGDRREGLVFPPLRTGRSGNGEAKAPYVRGIVEKAKAAARLKIRGMHDLRHHYGSWLLEQGFNIVEVQAILGHADVNTTRKYLHLPPDFVSIACSRLNGADLGWDSAPDCGSFVAAGPRKTKKPTSKIAGDRL